MIQCVFENDNKANLRHVTVDAIIVKDQQVLLAKRADCLNQGGKWCTPGGYVERDETIEDAIKREVREETGFAVNQVKLLAIITSPKRKNDERQSISFVHIVGVDKELGEPDSESQEVKWFDLDKLPSVDEFAFDHASFIDIYKVYLKEKFPLPLVK